MTAAVEITGPSKGVLQIMDVTGHTEMQWDPDDDAEVRKAQAAFDAALKNGYAAFALEPGGREGRQIRSFDKTAGRILMRPALVGG